MSRLRSVRFRITLVAAVVLAVVLTLAGATLLWVQREQLHDNLDASLSRRADDVSALLAPFDDPGHVLASAAGEDALVQVVTLDGQVVAGTENVIDIGPLAPPPAGTERIGTVDSLPVEDDSYRLLSRRIDSEGAELVLHVAENTDDADDVNRALLLALVVVVPAAVVALTALVWLLVGRALRPVEELRAEVDGIKGADLHRRVSDPGSGDEIARLAETMNSMLDRVQHASERQQRFVADASHELRSPLARMRAELEVDLANQGAADLAATHTSVLAETAELSRLLDDLLLLARSGPDAPAPKHSLVDLDDVVLREATAVRHRVAEIDIAGVAPTQTMGDSGQLARVVRNLLDNAVRHATSKVAVTLSESDEGVVLDVVDDGPGIAAEHAESIFERFTRIDEARSRAEGGAGLGLAIVRDIVDRHGGTVSVDLHHHPGARLVVHLPSNL